MAKLKAGVIGLGMGWGHLQGYLNHPDVEVVAVADRRPERRERAERTARRYSGDTQYARRVAVSDGEHRRALDRRIYVQA